MIGPCPHPLGLERVTAYLLGELDDADQHDLEQHLLGCASCTSAAEGVQALTASLAALLPPVISAGDLQRLRGKGMRILETEIRPGDDAEALFAADLDLMVHRLVTGPGDDERIDVEILGEAPDPLLRLEAVPRDPSTGAVYIACQRHYRDLGFPDHVRFRLVAVRGESRRILGEYGVRHRWAL